MLIVFNFVDCLLQKEKTIVAVMIMIYAAFAAVLSNQMDIPMELLFLG